MSGRTCPTCHVEVSPGAGVCSRCGSTLPRGAASDSAGSVGRRWGGLALVVLGAFLPSSPASAFHILTHFREQLAWGVVPFLFGMVPVLMLAGGVLAFLGAHRNARGMAVAGVALSAGAIVYGPILLSLAVHGFAVFGFFRLGALGFWLTLIGTGLAASTVLGGDSD